GSSGYETVIPFTKTIPASSPSMNRSCSSGWLVQALEPRPYGVSLARASADSRESARYTVATGPKTSSDQTRMDGSRSVRTVGGWVGGVVPAGLGGPSPAAPDPGALGHRVPHLLLDGVPAGFGGERAHVRTLGPGIAHDETGHPRDEFVDEAVIHVGMHDEAL